MFWLEIEMTPTKSIVLGFNTLAQPLVIVYIISYYYDILYITYRKYTQVPMPCAVLVESSPTTA